MYPVRRHLIICGTGEESTVGTRMARADRVVIGIEQKSVMRIERLIIREIRGQDHGLEEPRHMRAMPFRRTGIGHRLDHLVLRR